MSRKTQVPNNFSPQSNDDLPGYPVDTKVAKSKNCHERLINDQTYHRFHIEHTRILRHPQKHDYGSHIQRRRGKHLRVTHMECHV